MHSRRAFCLGAAMALCAQTTAAQAPLPQRFAPQFVQVNPRFQAGHIYVESSEHYLYWTLGGGKAIRYGVALGATGRQFKGLATISRKAEWPDWRPTANMIRLEPHLYGKYANGLPGGHPRNPMGARALYLAQNGRETYYRIHGTPDPHSIGRSFSSGCVRLRNDHIVDLYNRVPVGTRVFVM